MITYYFDFYKGSKVHPSLTPLHPPCPFWIKCRKMFLKCQIWSPSFHRVGSKRLKSVSKFGWVTSFILDHAGRWKRNKKKKQHGQIDCPNCKMDFSKLQNRFLQNANWKNRFFILDHVSQWERNKEKKWHCQIDWSELFADWTWLPKSTAINISCLLAGKLNCQKVTI